MKKLLLISIFIVLISVTTGCQNNNNIPQETNSSKTTIEKTTPNPVNKTTLTSSNYIKIKYRDSEVDINDKRFEKFSPINTTIAQEAWYDLENQYMIIKLNSTYYHYCNLPNTTWENLKGSKDTDSFYINHIKGFYDCRYAHVPLYPHPNTNPTYHETTNSYNKNYNFDYNTSSYDYYNSNDDQYIYFYDDCNTDEYCYGENENGEEVEIYIYDKDDGYGYGEDEYGNEIEFYYDE